MHFSLLLNNSNDVPNRRVRRRRNETLRRSSLSRTPNTDNTDNAKSVPPTARNERLNNLHNARLQLEEEEEEELCGERNDDGLTLKCDAFLTMLTLLGEGRSRTAQTKNRSIPLVSANEQIAHLQLLFTFTTETSARRTNEEQRREKATLTNSLRSFEQQDDEEQPQQHSISPDDRERDTPLQCSRESTSDLLNGQMKRREEKRTVLTVNIVNTKNEAITRQLKTDEDLRGEQCGESFFYFVSSLHCSISILMKKCAGQLFQIARLSAPLVLLSPTEQSSTTSTRSEFTSSEKKH